MLALLSLLAVLGAGTAGASTYLDLSDPSYDLLARLEAEGVIGSGVLTTRPISRAEAVRLLKEAEGRADGRSAVLKGLMNELRRRLAPQQDGEGGTKLLDRAYVRYVSTNAPDQVRSYPGADREVEQLLNNGNDGDGYLPGANGRIGMVSRIEDAGPFSLYLNPELRSADGREQLVLRTGYGVLGFSWIDIIAGKGTQWWGPGHHGAVLLSDNAEPLTMVRLTGPTPLALPWVLKYLGPFQYSFFVSRLDEERADHPEPFLWGLRLAFKPHRYVEIGLSRTAMLGGGDRPHGADTWINSIFARFEHEQADNPGDQRAGYDLKVTLPFRLQPVQLYWEQAGEENRQTYLHLPYKKANLYGVHLPRILGLDRVDLRAELAENHVNEQPYVWYTHGTYTSGYTYRGRVLGHHMGTDSRDLFASVAVRFPERMARVELSVERVDHDIPEAVRERDEEAVVRGSLRLTEALEIGFSQGFARTRNEAAVPGAAVRARATELSLCLMF